MNLALIHCKEYFNTEEIAMKQMHLAEMFPIKLSKNKQYNPWEAKSGNSAGHVCLQPKNWENCGIHTFFFSAYPKVNLTE